MAAAISRTAASANRSLASRIAVSAAARSRFVRYRRRPAPMPGGSPPVPLWLAAAPPLLPPGPPRPRCSAASASACASSASRSSRSRSLRRARLHLAFHYRPCPPTVVHGSAASSEALRQRHRPCVADRHVCSTGSEPAMPDRRQWTYASRLASFVATKRPQGSWSHDWHFMVPIARATDSVRVSTGQLALILRNEQSTSNRTHIRRRGLAAARDRRPAFVMASVF